MNFWWSYSAWLGRLADSCLSDGWYVHSYRGLPQDVRQLLIASSRIETMTLEQLLTQTRAIMTDDQKPEKSPHPFNEHMLRCPLLTCTKKT